MRAWLPVVCALAILPPARPAAAAAPATSEDQYAVRSWPSVAHTTTVRALRAQSSGALWIGTSEGLVRFDGQQMITVDGRRMPGVVGGNIERVFEASDGALWVGSRLDGLSRIDGATASSLRARDGLPGDLVRAFAETADGAIWVATFGGIARLARDGRPPEIVNDGLADARVDALVVDAAGVLWAGTRGGLARLEAGSRRWRPALGLLTAPVRVHALLAEPDGTLWAGTIGEGLLEGRGGAWRRHSARDGLGSDHVTALLRDRSGGLWVATRDGGLMRRANQRFERVSLPLGPCDQAIETLAEDAEGGLWIGTEFCGLHRVRPRPIRTIGPRAGLGRGGILGVSGAADGTVWVGTRGLGVARVGPAGLQVEPLACPAGLPCQSCWDIAPAAGATFWVVCGSNDLLRWDGRAMSRAALPAGLTAAAMAAVARDGALWLALDRQVVRSTAGGASHIEAQEPLAGKRVLYQGPSGTMWIAADDGVAAWRDGRVRQVVRFPASESAVEAANLHEDRTGGLWIATKGAGLRLVRAGRPPALIGVLQGLPTGWIVQVLEDDRDRLWLSTSKGILWIPRRELEEVADGRRAHVLPSVYDGADGVLMSFEAYGHPAGWKGPDGRLWFATDAGVAVVNPAAVGTAAPPVLLDELRLGADRIEARAGLAGRVPAFGPGPRDLHARFSARTFAPPEQVFFRYRLEGKDRDWTDAGPGRIAHYPALEPGRYQLLVAARHRDGDWSGQPARFSFVLRPPFYLSLWFAPLVAVAVGLVLLAAHHLRLARTRAALGAVMAERARIARDVHDTLAQAFVATSVQLECLHRALRSEDLPTMQRHLEAARRMVKESLDEARRSIWVLRPPVLERGLPAALESLVGGAASGETVVELEVTGAVRGLPPLVEANLLRIAQEGVSNAYRHAHARRIVLALAFAPRTVTLTITDDGSGLEGAGEGEPPRQRGLTGMKERAAQIRGLFSIDSAPAGGTAIRVEVPA